MTKMLAKATMHVPNLLRHQLLTSRQRPNHKQGLQQHYQALNRMSSRASSNRSRRRHATTTGTPSTNPPRPTSGIHRSSHPRSNNSRSRRNTTNQLQLASLVSRIINLTYQHTILQSRRPTSRMSSRTTTPRRNRRSRSSTRSSQVSVRPSHSATNRTTRSAALNQAPRCA